MVKKLVFAILVGFVSVGHNQQYAQAQTSDELIMSYGAFDIGRNKAFEGRLEYRLPEKISVLKPIIGILATSRGSAYGYAGLNFDYAFSKPFLLTLNFATGAYKKGPGKELGGIIEFRSGIELVYQINSNIRMGIAFHHISNASIYHSNPGANTLSYIFTIHNIFAKNNF